MWLFVGITVRAVWFKGPPVVREKGDMSVGDHQSCILWETMPGSGTRGMMGCVVTSRGIRIACGLQIASWLCLGEIASGEI